MMKKLNKRLRLVLITDSRLVGEGFYSIIEKALEGGVTAVQLREKEMDQGELMGMAYRLKDLCKEYGALLIINHFWEIAKEVGADGVHLGWKSISVSKARETFRKKMIIGYSAHNLDNAKQAERDGADYVSLSPVFETPSKSGILPALGLDKFRKITWEMDIPVVGLGGISLANCADVIEAGADGVAMIRELMLADDVMRRADLLTDIIGGHLN